MQAEELIKKGTEAVKKLRLQKLANGDFFLINAQELPTGQSYIEYPDGNMALVCLDESKKDFTVLKMLSAGEINSLRQRYSFT